MKRILGAIVLPILLVFGSSAYFTACEGYPLPKGCCTVNDRLDVVMNLSLDALEGPWDGRCILLYRGIPKVIGGIPWCLDLGKH